MKTVKTLKKVSLVFGIIVTLFFLLAFGPKFVGEFIEQGATYFIEIKDSFITWDDPNAFFITYFIGYILLWWKPLWGSIIIILVSITYVIIAGISGPPIFAIPAFIVGVLYFLYWNSIRQKELNKQSSMANE
jgi:hypothetical protein